MVLLFVVFTFLKSCSVFKWEWIDQLPPLSCSAAGMRRRSISHWLVCRTNWRCGRCRQAEKTVAPLSSASASMGKQVWSDVSARYVCLSYILCSFCQSEETGWMIISVNWFDAMPFCCWCWCWLGLCVTGLLIGNFFYKFSLVCILCVVLFLY